MASGVKVVAPDEEPTVISYTAALTRGARRRPREARDEENMILTEDKPVDERWTRKKYYQRTLPLIRERVKEGEGAPGE